ncbi:chaperone protein dnaJ 20, chloroplastic-like [Argentina anserina]|uniref:chaperone protein dnaJ 20, chloroplastic-like n=1 Tax=Argentina anserina TaxID=57926 RepID=UPI0021768C6D|nr:chaperone protein dnaJ 20, chloroplastic-like [Potentilla anserina]
MDDIKRAYRSMALRYHPDVADHRDDDTLTKESTRLFVQLNEAYKTLSDPVLREEYDYELGLAENLSSCSSSCRSITYKFRKDLRNVGPNSQWKQQILELKRRSTSRLARKEESWASRVKRTQRVSTMEN